LEFSNAKWRLHYDFGKSYPIQPQERLSHGQQCGKTATDAAAIHAENEQALMI
jgi:hypothetical protein